MMTSSLKYVAGSLPLFLAESTTDSVKSSALGEWVVIGAAVLVIVQVGWTFLDRVRGGTPQQNIVSFAEQFATHAQHAELKKEVEKVDYERRTSVANLHKKIEDVRAQLDSRIDEIPGRTIALLNETKQLHHR